MYQYYRSNAIALLITISIDNFNIGGRYIIREKCQIDSFNSFRYLSVINSIASLLSFKRHLPLTFPRVAKRDYECNAIIVFRKYDRKFEFIFATEFQRTFLRPINLIPFFNCISDNKYINKYRNE